MAVRQSVDFEDDDDDDDEQDPEGPTLADRESPDESDMDDSDDDDTNPCPYCRKPVYDGAEVCPHCRNFISFEDAPRSKPWWVWVGLILAILGLVWWIF